MSAAPRSILVTGSTGQIGRHVVAALTNGETRTALFCGNRAGLGTIAAAGRALDFRDRASLVAAFEGIESLFLVLPIVPEKRRYAENVVAAARIAGVRRILRSSGSGADVSSRHDYLRLQGEIDAIILDSGIPATIIRPNSLMQDYVGPYRSMLREGALCLAHGDARMSFIAAEDVASCAATILLNPEPHLRRIYTLTGQQALDHATAVDIVGAAVGRMIDYVPVDGDLASRIMIAHGADPWRVQQLAGVDRFVAEDGAAAISDAFPAVVGHKPKWFASFVADNSRAWQ